MKKLLIRYAIMTGRYSILIFSFIAFSSSVLSAKSGYGQEPDTKKVYLTIEADKQPLRAIFKDIEQKTAFSFFYNASNFNVNQQITLHLKHQSLYHILRLLTDKTGLEFKQVSKHISVRLIEKKNKGKNYHLFSLLTNKLTIPTNISAYHALTNMPVDTSIRGKVTDEKGEPLIGVTVQVVGTNAGTVTDAQGNFLLNVPVKDSLIFSYIGYKEKKIAVSGRSSMDIQLSSSAAGLNEVVVVGYGTQRKLDVTGSVSQVSGEAIRKTPTASLQNALAGKLPGLFTQQRSGAPGGASAAQIHIRGISSYNGSGEPLVLVDNVPYNIGQLFLIDPSSIKSVTILKDAAATAIYGIKGANGVILITTRRGQVGKPVIQLTTQWGIQTPVHLLKTLGAYQTALLRNEALKNAGLSPVFTQQDLDLFKSGADPYGHPNVDWNTVLFKRASLMTNNNLNISGGTNRVRYFISLGYLWQNGRMRNIPYKGPDSQDAKNKDINNNYYLKRYKFRSNLDLQATKSLHFQLDISGTYAETNTPEANFAISEVYQYEYLNPYMYPVYNPNGTFGYANPARLSPRNLQNNVAGLISLGGYNRALNDFLNVHLSGEQKLDVIIPGLSVKAVAAYSTANTASRSLHRGGNFPSYFYNPVDSSYNPRNQNIYEIAPYSLGYGGGVPNHRIDLQAALNYERSFGHSNVSGLVLFNQTSYIQGATPPSNFRGYTFRVAYNYKHKYLLEISGAYNGSSRFVSQKRYNLFPAVSGGWNLGMEPFFNKLFPFIGLFKIKGSYGIVGSDDVGGYHYIYQGFYSRSGTYSFGETNNTENGIKPAQIGNDNVTWETGRKTDIGLDFGLLKGQITGSVDYFNNYRYHILTKRSTIPQYFGIQTSNLPPVNIGKVRNKGYEIELAYHGKIGQVGINVKGNLSFAKNKILFEDEPPPKYPYQEETGRSIGMIKQYVWTGTFYQDQKDIDSSAVPAGNILPGYLKYKDMNGDGKIDIDDMAYVGYPNLPNTNVGLTLGFDYKGFSFSVLLQSALNFDVSGGFDWAIPFKAVMQPLFLNSWTPEKASTATFPLLTTLFNGTYMSPEGNPSTFWTVSGNYLRIRSANLSYTFPNVLIKRIGLDGLQVFVNGYNLFTWSKVLKRYQFDPEVNEGTDSFVYPAQRIVNFGLRLTFK